MAKRAQKLRRIGMLTQHVLLQMILIEELLTTRGTNKRLSKLVIIIGIIRSTLLRFTLILGRDWLLTLLLTTQNTINRVIMRLLLQLLLQNRLIRNHFISITIRLLYLNLLIEQLLLLGLKLLLLLLRLANLRVGDEQLIPDLETMRVHLY